MPTIKTDSELDLQRLADWILEEYHHFGSWPKVVKAIAAANPGTKELTDQTLIDWSIKKNKSIHPTKIKLLANYRGETYQQTYNWLHGKQDDVIEPDLIRRIQACKSMVELSAIGDQELFPAVQRFMDKVMELSGMIKEVESNISIAEFIQEKIKQKKITLAEGIADICDCYPRRSKATPEQVSDFIRGNAEPIHDHELIELCFALSQFLGQSISPDELIDEDWRLKSLGL